jgi:hypothetical protein
MSQEGKGGAQFYGADELHAIGFWSRVAIRTVKGILENLKDQAL